MIEILQVNNKKLLKSFIDFQYDLYAKDPNFVPELYIFTERPFKS